MAESNVALTRIDDLVPFQIEPRAKYRGGDEPDQVRIEEIRRRGVRPSDAERIERLERELDLEDEFSELRRVWAAAVLRANPDARREARRRLMLKVYIGDLLPYDALSLLHDLELVDEDLNFARLRTEDVFGNSRFELVLYEGGTPQVALRFFPDSQTVELNRSCARSAWYASLPE
jgi:hypothetical protein